MLPDPTRRSPGDHPGLDQIPDANQQIRRQLSRRSPLDQYLEGRERVLGRRVSVTLADPERAAVEVLEASDPAWCSRLVEQLGMLLREVC